MAAQFYQSDEEEDSFTFDDPYLGLGDDPSLFDQDSWWKGRDYDALAYDQDWSESFEGRRYMQTQAEERNRQIDAQAELDKDLPPSRWVLEMEEEDILQCMSEMFLRAEAEAASSKQQAVKF